MILRCDAPQKRDRFRLCGRWFATAPDGSSYRRILRHEAPQYPRHIIVDCDCGAIYAIEPPREAAAQGHLRPCVTARTG
jgi:hypothetical protein